jgi:hypothetical protein
LSNVLANCKHVNAKIKREFLNKNIGNRVISLAKNDADYFGEDL